MLFNPGWVDDAKMSLFNQAAEMVLQRVAAGSSGADHADHCDTAVQIDVVDDLNGQLGCGWGAGRHG